MTASHKAFRLFAAGCLALGCSFGALAQDAEPETPATPEAPATPQAPVDLVGQPAPEIAPTGWINGEAFTLASAKGKVVIVEFWATWCPPCRESIPHLNELYQDLKDEGLMVVGISDEDEATVKGFYAKQTEMTYHVAHDTDRKAHTAYLEAVGAEGIPHAFVIDKAGLVAWHGHPMDGMDEVVEQLIAGTFDADQQKKLGEGKAAFQAAVEALGSEEDLPTLIAPLDALIQLDPKNPEHYEIKTEVLDRIGEGDKVPAVWMLFGNNAGDDADALAIAANRLAHAGDVSRRRVGSALAFANKAVEATDGKDADSLAVAASIYYAACRLDQAIALQKRAVVAAGDDEEFKEELTAALTFYESLSKLAGDSKQ
ncbi:MAG: peroxiredoxin family protein [Planctomycetota bacterium]|jgi:thiol-disulfide isomerase/thioredoxin